MLLSFVITYHNEAQSLVQQCVESVLSLQLRAEEREVLLVDDGSERSLEECFGQRYPEVCYIRQENRGLSKARNTGLRACRGRYVQFVDADDCLVTDVYDRRVIGYLREGGLEMLMYRFSTQEGEACDEASEALMVWRGAEFLLHHNMRAAACVYVFSRELLGQLRFEPGILHEDVLFTPQLMLKAERLASIHAKAYFYRQHVGTITSRRGVEHVRRRLSDCMTIILKLRQEAALRQGVEQRALLRVVHQQTMDSVVIAFTHGGTGMALRHMMALKAAGLLPLPLACYTPKYWLLALFLRVTTACLGPKK